MSATDGSANAPAGTPQLPTLLSGYAVRPSWNVAGVDYYVGVSAGTVLQNPATITMAGVTVDSTNHTVTITGDNVALSGYDFSLNGGWQVYVAGNNDTIKNCNFGVGSNQQPAISIGVNGQTASNTTVEYNTINGNGISSAGVGLIECSGIGTTTIEYNSITNAYNEAIVLGNTTSSTANYVVQYNLIENTGEGSPQGAHGDWIQLFNTPGDTSSVAINYNTFAQNAPGMATQGLSLQSAAIPQGPVLSETVTNNTMVVTGSNTVNYAIIADTTNLNGSATIANNYIVPTGIAYGWNFFGQYNNPDGSYNGTVTDYNNINMVTGASFDGNATGVTPAAPTIITGVANSNGSVTLTGTAPDGSTISVSDGGATALGTTTASSTGAWTFTTADLAAGSYAFTATDTTSAGTSAASTPFDGTVTASPPAAPVIKTGVENSNGAVTLTGTAPDGAPVTVSDGGSTALGTTTASSSGTWTFTTADLAAGTYAFTATATTSAGTSAASSPLDVSVTPQPGPTLSAIAESPASGDLNAGSTVTLTLKLSEAVTVAGGTPTLTLNDGGIATYTGGSGTNALTFSYTVGAGQDTAALAATAVNLNSATITDGAGNGANLSLTGLAQSGPQIDTTAPTSTPPSPTSGTTPVDLVANGSFGTDSLSGWTLGGNYTSTFYGPEIFTDTNAEGASTYAAEMGSVGSDGSISQTIATTAGQKYQLTFWLANDLNGAGTTPNDFTAKWNGTSLLSLTNAPQQGYTEYTYDVVATSSSTTLEFDARQDPSSWSLDNISLTPVGTGVTDPPPAGGGSSPPTVTPQPGPTLSAIAESPASGDLNAGSTVTLTLKLSEAVTVAGGTPTLTLNDGGIATYTGGSGTNALTFSYTVGAGQDTAALAATAVNLNSATITDGAGNGANLSLTGLAQSGPQIDTTAPTSTPPSPTSGTTPVDLVANGSFGTDSLSGWTLGGNYTSTFYGPEIFTDTNAEGASTYAAEMGSVGSDGSISQTIATTAGQKYQLTFWLANDLNGAGTTPNDFTAKWNGTSLLSLTNAPQQGYTEYTYDVVATSSSTTLEFDARQDPSSWSLDNISLTPVGTGVTIGTGATLEISAADFASVTFNDSTGMLKLDTPSTFSGEIFNFTGNGRLSGSDQIDLKNINYNSVQDNYANGVLTVTDGNGETDKLDFNGSYSLANFSFASDGSGGTIVYDPPAPTTSSQDAPNTTSTGTSGPPRIGTSKTLELNASDPRGAAFTGSAGTLILDGSAPVGQALDFTGRSLASDARTSLICRASRSMHKTR